VAATNQDLDQAMQSGAFRRDLYYRLSVVCLRIPPLRERPDDIELLARNFATRFAAAYNRPELAHVDDETLEAMRRHPFEGNVRELENLIKRAILLGSYREVLAEVARRAAPAIPTAATNPPVLASHAEPDEPAPQAAGPFEPPFFAPRAETAPLKEVARRAVEEAERRAIVRALTSTGWNRRHAARLLQISYRSLLYKIRDYAIMPLGAEDTEILETAEAAVTPPEGSC
jgi:two-component system, NtrC family, response regulator AtoC